MSLDIEGAAKPCAYLVLIGHDYEVQLPAEATPNGKPGWEFTVTAQPWTGDEIHIRSVDVILHGTRWTVGALNLTLRPGDNIDHFGATISLKEGENEPATVEERWVP